MVTMLGKIGGGVIKRGHGSLKTVDLGAKQGHRAWEVWRKNWKDLEKKR